MLYIGDIGKHPVSQMIYIVLTYPH